MQAVFVHTSTRTYRKILLPQQVNFCSGVNTLVRLRVMALLARGTLGSLRVKSPLVSVLASTRMVSTKRPKALMTGVLLLATAWTRIELEPGRCQKKKSKAWPPARMKPSCFRVILRRVRPSYAATQLRRWMGEIVGVTEIVGVFEIVGVEVGVPVPVGDEVALAVRVEVDEAAGVDESDTVGEAVMVEVVDAVPDGVTPTDVLAVGVTETVEVNEVVAVVVAVSVVLTVGVTDRVGVNEAEAVNDVDTVAVTERVGEDEAVAVSVAV